MHGHAMDAWPACVTGAVNVRHRPVPSCVWIINKADSGCQVLLRRRVASSFPRPFCMYPLGSCAMLVGAFFKLVNSHCDHGGFLTAREESFACASYVLPPTQSLCHCMMQWRHYCHYCLTPDIHVRTRVMRHATLYALPCVPFRRGLQSLFVPGTSRLTECCKKTHTRGNVG